MGNNPADCAFLFLPVLALAVPAYIGKIELILAINKELSDMTDSGESFYDGSTFYINNKEDLKLIRNVVFESTIWGYINRGSTPYEIIVGDVIFNYGDYPQVIVFKRHYFFLSDKEVQPLEELLERLREERKE